MTDDRAQPLPPLVNRRAMDEWCADLGKEEVAEILAWVPVECRKYVADIEKALSAGQLPAVRRAAHSLKGMAGNLGADRLSQAARVIELDCEHLEDVLAQIGNLKNALTATLAALSAA